jgi:Na+-driven multidrug efflux pump
VLFLIPGLLIFPIYFGQTGVWMSMPVSDFVATITSAGMLYWHFKNVKKLKAEAADASRQE